MKRQSAKHNPFLAACEVGGATFTIATEDGDVIKVTAQLTDANGVANEKVLHCRAFLASSATTLAKATAPDTLAIAAKGEIKLEDVSNVYFSVTTNEDGQFDINIGKSGAATYYLVIELPTGNHAVSSAITFAA